MDSINKFSIIIGYILENEGGDVLSLDFHDDGNWTGGTVNSGKLVGSKFGISAASYPNLDIPDLTEDQAKQIYLTDYWNKIGGDNLPLAIGFLLCDACVNSGITSAVSYMQSHVLGLTSRNVDGVCGPSTQKLLNSFSSQKDLCLQFSIARLIQCSTFNNWSLYKTEYIKRNITNSMTAQYLLDTYDIK